MHKTTPASATASTFPSFLTASVFSQPTSSASRPATRDGSLSVDPHHHPPQSPPPPVPSSGAAGFVPAHKEPRKLSFSRKAASLSGASTRRRGSSSAALTDATAPPALPDYALLAAAKVSTGRSPVTPDAVAHGAGGGGYFGTLSRTPTSLSTTTTMASGGFMQPPPTPMGSAPAPWQPSEASAMHQHIADMANKRISTLDYLRKACVTPPFVTVPIPAANSS